MTLGKNQIFALAGAVICVLLLYFLPSEKSGPAPDAIDSAAPVNRPHAFSANPALNTRLLDAVSRAEGQPSEDNFLQAAELFNDVFSSETDTVHASLQAQKAIYFYQKTLEKNPGNINAKAGLGWCTALSSNEPMKGIMMLREVVKEFPDHERTSYYLGLLSVKSGQFQKAIERFETVKKINSENINVLLPLGEAYFSVGNKEKALENLSILKNQTKDKELSTQASILIERINSAR